MTDSSALRNAVKEKGIKYRYIASQLGISPYSLQKKIDNINDFKGKEIEKLSNILNLSVAERDAIFFANKVD